MLFFLSTRLGPELRAAEKAPGDGLLQRLCKTKKQAKFHAECAICLLIGNGQATANAGPRILVAFVFIKSIYTFQKFSFLTKAKYALATTHYMLALSRDSCVCVCASVRERVRACVRARACVCAVLASVLYLFNFISAKIISIIILY